MPAVARAAEAERVADRHHPVADARLGAVLEADVRERPALDLQHRQVGGRVAPDDARREVAVVLGHHGDLLGVATTWLLVTM